MAKKSLLLVIIFCLMLSGCGSEAKVDESVPDTISKTELLRVGTEAFPLRYARVFAFSQKNQYEKSFGDNIWSVRYGNTTFEDRLMDGLRTQMALMFASYAMADSLEVTLSTAEEKKIRSAAADFCSKLESGQLEALECNEADIVEILRIYALSRKVYTTVCGSVGDDLSEDETRVVKLQEIRIKTYGLTDEEKDKKLTLMAEALNLLGEGEDFSSVASKYSETGDSVYKADRNSLSSTEAKTVFSLATDETSPVITLPDAYVIYKCVDSFDKEASALNRTAILNSMEDKAFKGELDSFLYKNPLRWNEEAWGSIDIPNMKLSASASIYTAYQIHFGEENK